VVGIGRPEGVVAVVLEGAVGKFKIMSATIIRFVVAIVVATAAWVSWSEARLADRVADTKEHIATLRFDEVVLDLDGRATLSEYLPTDRKLTDDVRVATATAAYWLGRYDAVTADTNNAAADAEVLLTAANAAFRDSQRTPGTGQAAVQRLDGVLNAYASALKAAPTKQGSLGAEVLAKEAAYNYEYVARLRDQVARSQGKTIKPAPPVTLRSGDLPSGATIHGRPGAPPPEAEMEQLQMIAPMEYGDREAQPEAMPGGKRERKG
jgi:hypothetical protein